MCKVLLENINLYNEIIKNLLYIIVTFDKSRNVRVALGKALSKVFNQKKYNSLKELSLHKICKLLNDKKSISISNIFNNIDLKNCEGINDNILFDLNYINNLIENKVKIICYTNFPNTHHR